MNKAKQLSLISFIRNIRMLSKAQSERMVFLVICQLAILSISRLPYRVTRSFVHTQIRQRSAKHSKRFAFIQR